MRTPSGHGDKLRRGIIGATFLRDILLVFSSLVPEDTCMEAAHYWVFDVKSGRLMEVSIVF